MKIREILLQLGIPSNEIKVRAKQGIIKLNGEPVDINTELTICMELENNTKPLTQSIGDFLFWHICKNPVGDHQTWVMRAKIFGVEALFDSNINDDLTRVVSNYLLLMFSKKDGIVLTKDLFSDINPEFFKQLI